LGHGASGGVLVGEALISNPNTATKRGVGETDRERERMNINAEAILLLGFHSSFSSFYYEHSKTYRKLKISIW
jgi:hypothetical protein